MEAKLSPSFVLLLRCGAKTKADKDSFSKVTFENDREVRKAAKSVPIERIMVETYAPISRRHQTVPSAVTYLRETAAFIANLRGMTWQHSLRNRDKTRKDFSD